MYHNHRQLLKDYQEERIGAKDVFFHAHRLGSQERRKFINKARDVLMIKP